jgi:DNA helicase-2/ATP-dependent DNA helicase PcrA
MSFAADALLVHLNDKQREVVKTVNGPLLVLAGAGSGKTRSVIYRVAWLIQVENVKPWNILVVTFTNKAARELKDRLFDLLGERGQSVWIGTFHSICLRIMRYEITHLKGFNSDFSVYDRDDQVTVVKKVYKAHNIDKDVFPVQKTISLISKFKSQLITPENFFDYQDNRIQNKTFHLIYKSYCDYLKHNNAMDFDDILLYMVELLEMSPDVLNKYQNQFRYIMIDEYQDTNYVQFKIIHLLSKKHQNLCVVGDDDQSIYGWRGANVENILSFEKDYKNVKTIKLEQNYRSTTCILNLANDIIKNNKNRHSKELWTNIEGDQLPQLISHDNDNEEARYIAEEIALLRDKNTILNECAVLYRTNFQSRVLEQAFSKYQIPYQVVGGINFYQRLEIKDMIAWLRVITNPNDNESLLRVINLPPRGLGKTTITNLIQIALVNNLPLYQIISQEEYIASVSKKAKASLLDFVSNIEKWKSQAGNVSVVETIKDIISVYNLEDYYQNIDEGKEQTKLENMREFIAAASDFTENYYAEHQQFPEISLFLQFLSLQTDLDNADKDSQKEAVKLMTMHNAKGLEFDYVFVSGLEKGLLPHLFSSNSESEIEEERRLFYVAVTRARKRLYLNYAHSRRMGDSFQSSSPSIFLGELNTELYEEVKASFWEFHAPRKVNYKPVVQKEKTYISENEKYYKIGQKILHQQFGKGVIINVDGLGKDAKLTISFYNGTMKKIIGTWVELEDE